MKGRPSTKKQGAREKRVLSMLKAGKTTNEMAAALGITRQSMWAYLKRRNWHEDVARAPTLKERFGISDAG